MAGRVKVLNVAEKPSVAKGITELLAKGRSTLTKSSVPQHPIWSFDYQVDGHNCEMNFTSVRGHLQGWHVPPNIEDNWQVDPIVLFDCPVTKKTAEDLEPVARMLKTEAKRADWLILWLDCDREGENIAFEVLNICKASNRNLRVRRARFSALIARDIEHSLRNLTDPNKAESDAVDVRMELDLRIGFAFTRFQTSRWRYKYEFQTDATTISYGPCQFPTLGFVVDQYWKHMHFKPESFWHLDLEVVKDGAKAAMTWRRVRLFDYLACLIIYENLLENTDCQVVKVDKRPATKYRPFPLTTVELQKCLSKWLHIPSQETMNIAERLYQAGFISYPRTETNKFPPNFDFHTLIQEQTQSTTWGDYATQLLDPEFFRVPKAGTSDDASHPPIHPLKFADSLNGRDAQVYEFIVRHYLACCSQDALGHETVVEVSIGPEIFGCTGLAIQALNFLEIYRYQKWSDSSIPNFVLGEMVTPTKLVMEEGKTTAPPLLTEADLIQLMNQNGIGTDATIAEHISTIIARNYVTKKGARMEMWPTQLGEALVAGYNFIGYRHLNQPQLRAGLENDLKRICLRQIDKDSVLKQQIEMYKQVFVEVRTKVRALDKALGKYFQPSGSIVLHEERNFSKCGTCGNLMSLRVGNAEANFIHCATCQVTLRLPMGSISNGITHDTAPPNFPCPICKFQVISATSKNGKVFTVCPQCYNTPPEHIKPHLKMDTATGDVQNMPCFLCTQQGCPLKGGSISYDQTPIRNCPACTSPMIIRQSKNQAYYLSCSNYPACRKAIWFPVEIVKEVKPTGSSCPTCTHTPSGLVEIRYSPREAFENGKDYDIGCFYGCPGGSKAVKSLLEEITHGLATWETSASPSAPPEARGAGASNAKAVGQKRTAAGSFGRGPTTSNASAASHRNYVHSGSTYGAKTTANAKGVSTKRSNAKSGATAASNAKYPSKTTGNTTSSTNRTSGIPRATPGATKSGSVFAGIQARPTTSLVRSAVPNSNQKYAASKQTGFGMMQ